MDYFNFNKVGNEILFYFIKGVKNLLCLQILFVYKMFQQY